MMMEWTPEHPGRWLFHCHLLAHISTGERVPIFTRANSKQNTNSATTTSAHHEDMGEMNDMAGLVLVINVKASSSAPAESPAKPPRKLDLVIEKTAADAKVPAFSCSVREGKKIVLSEDKSVGPAIVLTRGEPVEITVVNHLDAPTTIHWHGLVLDSYYDGVVGGGVGDQITPAIQPGASFVARFTPNRAGTFIYHTHAVDLTQLSGGIYGGLIVLEPGESFDADRDKLLVLGARDNDFYTTHMTLNGSEVFRPIELRHGVKHRLRLINIAPNLGANIQLGTADHPATWRALAKDGVDLPSRLATEQDAVLHIMSGEVYDFEFQPDKAGELPFQIENNLNKAKTIGRIVVQ